MAEKPEYAPVTVVRRPATAAVLWFLVAAAGYAVAAWWLNLRVGYLFGDSLSRVAAVSAVLLSRDPHLGAIGFVFTPLTAVAQLPLGAFAGWFPGLLRWNVTAAAVSVLFMAGAVVQMRGIGIDRGAPRWLTVTMVVLFAANPMIVLYAANGMSEAPFLFFGLWATRRLLRWLRSDDVHDLIALGLALAGAYLTRYDALAAAVVVIALTIVVTGVRRGATVPDLRGRVWAGLADGVVVAFPVVVTVLVWAASSWLLTGSALVQFDSVYGNSAILEQTGGSAGGITERAGFVGAALMAMGPAVPVMLFLAIVTALRRRDPALVAPVAVFGTVLVTQALLHVVGATFPLLRFFIVAIPLTAVAGLLVGPARSLAPARRPGPAAWAGPGGRTGGPAPQGAAVVRAAQGLVAVVVAGAVVVTGAQMTDRQIAAAEAPIMRHLLPGDTDESDGAVLRTFAAERRIAEYLDDMGLPDGAVLLDTVQTFAVVVSSDSPRQFVVPSDGDFVEILDDPVGADVRYLLTVPNEGRGTSDAINRRYPMMYDDGADGLGELVLEIPNDGAEEPVAWRLYRVVDQG